jgi:hypothetical protein
MGFGTRKITEWSPRYAEMEGMNILDVCFNLIIPVLLILQSALYARSQKKKTYPPSMDHRATRSENRNDFLSQ